MMTLIPQSIRRLAPPFTGDAAPSLSPPATIEQVKSQRQRTEFVDFPESLYAGDPNWCQPLKIEAHAALNPNRHPFFKHGAAAHFLARRGGQVVGRIAVSDDPHYNAEHSTPEKPSNVGCFGMFECIDDAEVARSLLNAAARWLRSRARTSIMGPVDYSTNYPSGLLVEGFDTPQRVMMNYNPPYYAKLLESWGLKKAKDLYAWWFDGDNPALEEWVPRAQRLAARGGITIRPIRFADFDAEVQRCMQVYNDTWEKMWGFVKMTPEEFHHMARQLKQMAVPEMVLLAEVAGQPVGFCLTLPDFNEAIRPLSGRLTNWGLPIGLLRLLRGLKKIRAGRMVALGVLPGYRKRGIAELLILQTFLYGRKTLGYHGAELSWTLEDNDAINNTIQAVGGRRYKRFRIYERTI
jgi:GNAT superfamily N-acetyltransferase